LEQGVRYGRAVFVGSTIRTGWLADSWKTGFVGDACTVFVTINAIVVTRF
jgi:hypothetical protein